MCIETFGPSLLELQRLPLQARPRRLAPLVHPLKLFGGTIADPLSANMK